MYFVISGQNKESTKNSYRQTDRHTKLKFLPELKSISKTLWNTVENELFSMLLNKVDWDPRDLQHMIAFNLGFVFSMNIYLILE